MLYWRRDYHGKSWVLVEDEKVVYEVTDEWVESVGFLTADLVVFREIGHRIPAHGEGRQYVDHAEAR